MTPHHISFLKSPSSSSFPCQHRVPRCVFHLYTATHLHIEISCNVEISGFTTASFPYQSPLPRVRGVNGHHQSGSEENGCTSLFEPPRSLDCAKLVRNQHRCEPNIASMPHLSRPFHVRGSRFFDGENDIHTCVHARRLQEFSAITETSDEHWLLIFTEISCQHLLGLWVRVQPYGSAVSCFKKNVAQELQGNLHVLREEGIVL